MVNIRITETGLTESFQNAKLLKTQYETHFNFKDKGVNILEGLCYKMYYVFIYFVSR